MKTGLHVRELGLKAHCLHRIKGQKQQASLVKEFDCFKPLAGTKIRQQLQIYSVLTQAHQAVHIVQALPMLVLGTTDENANLMQSQAARKLAHDKREM